MNRHKNVFYINIISGYLEKFIVGNMPSVAYFSKEIMFMREKKLYNIEKYEMVRDYIDLAQDYELPVDFIGLLWSKEGEKFQNYNDDFIQELEDLDCMVDIDIINKSIKAKVWRVRRGNVKIYLLDCNIEENEDKYRDITKEEFENLPSNKIMSDLVISKGGIKLINELNLNYDKYHFNGEFMLFSVYQMLKDESMRNDYANIDFELNKIRSKCVVTIHDIHLKNYSMDELDQYIIGNDYDRNMAKRVFQSNNIFTNMVLNSCASNSSCIIHGNTIRKRIENNKVKGKLIDIVNSIYLQNHLNYDILNSFKTQKNILNIHMKLKDKFIQYIYSKTFVKLKRDKLIIGMITTSNEYERWNLILRDREKLFKLLEEGNVQFVFYVQPSKSSNSEISFKKYISIKKKYPNNIIFMNNADEALEKKMLNGCDVLLNTSKIPHDVCGLSRIKGAINGVLPFSTMNGCWPEVCVEGINGWQIGSGIRIKNAREQDEHDLESLYDVLNSKIIPTYYEDKEKWEDIMTQSIKSTLEYFCIERLIIEYTENLYRN